MMIARKAFVIKSMIVMPMPSQNKIKPRSRFMTNHTLSDLLIVKGKITHNLFYAPQ